MALGGEVSGRAVARYDPGVKRVMGLVGCDFNVFSIDGRKIPCRDILAHTRLLFSSFAFPHFPIYQFLLILHHVYFSPHFPCHVRELCGAEIDSRLHILCFSWFVPDNHPKRNGKIWVLRHYFLSPSG